MSSQQVHNKSTSKTTERQVSFPLTVPAGEGRKVAETTTVSSVDTIYQARIGATNTVGIQTHIAWDQPEHYYFFYDISLVFCGNVATAQITDSTIATTVDTVITKIPPPGDGEDKSEKGELVAFESERPGSFPPEKLPLHLRNKVGIAVKRKKPVNPPKSSLQRKGTQGLKLMFNTSQPAVPADERDSKTTDFRTEILGDFNLNHALIPPYLTTVKYLPNSLNPDSASFAVIYNSDVITKINLRHEIIHHAGQVNWGGKYFLEFTPWLNRPERRGGALVAQSQLQVLLT